MDTATRNKFLKERTLYERKLQRVVEELQRLNKVLGRPKGDTCFSCPQHTADSTDLSMCEIGNLNYPERCTDKSEDNWELYLKASATLNQMTEGL